MGYYLSRLALIVLGLIWPAWASWRAIRFRRVRDQRHWLMFWIVFAFFQMFEGVGDVLVSWIPFYYEFKILVVLYFALPQTHGAQNVFRRVVHPRMLQNEQRLDRTLAQLSDGARSAGGVAMRLGIDALAEGRLDALRAAFARSEEVVQKSSAPEEVSVMRSGEVPAAPTREMQLQRGDETAERDWQYVSPGSADGSGRLDELEDSEFVGLDSDLSYLDGIEGLSPKTPAAHRLEEQSSMAVDAAGPLSPAEQATQARRASLRSFVRNRRQHLSGAEMQDRLAEAGM